VRVATTRSLQEARCRSDRHRASARQGAQRGDQRLRVGGTAGEPVVARGDQGPGVGEQRPAGVGQGEARDAGVRALVHLSGADAAEDSPLPWAHAIWQIDEQVRASGLAYTLVRPSGFMTNLESSAPAIRRGFLPQTMGRGVIPWIDTADIARVAAHVLHGATHDGAEHLVTGPELLDGRGVARSLSAGLDRTVRYVHLPSRAFAGLLRANGVPAWQAEGLRQQFGRVARHGLDGIDVQTDEVERLTGRPARALADWARSRRATLLG